MNDAIDAYYVECCKLIFGTLNDAHELVNALGDDLYALGNATKNSFNFGNEKIELLKYLLSKVSPVPEHYQEKLQAIQQDRNLL